MDRKKMEHTVELVAQAIHDAEPRAYLWEDEAASCKERLREYARNAIKLLDDDIDVLLLALKENAAEQPDRRPTAAA